MAKMSSKEAANFMLDVVSTMERTARGEATFREC